MLSQAHFLFNFLETIMQVILRWFLVPLFFGLGAVTLIMKGFCLSGVIELLISMALFGLSFMTKAAIGELAQLASDAASSVGGVVASGAEKATPHVGEAAEKVAMGAKKGVEKLCEKVMNDVTFSAAILSAFVAMYFFGSAYMRHSWQDFHLGLFATAFSLFCFATKYDWWDGVTKNCVDNKKGRVWTWLFISLVGLALSAIHGWKGVGILSVISTAGAVITIVEGWGYTQKHNGKFVGKLFFTDGYGVSMLAWSVVCFLYAISPLLWGEKVGPNQQLAIALMVILLFFGIPITAKEKTK